VEEIDFSLPSRAGNGCTPQATMVELIQLGGGGCKGGKLPPLQRKRVEIG